MYPVKEHEFRDAEDGGYETVIPSEWAAEITAEVVKDIKEYLIPQLRIFKSFDVYFVKKLGGGHLGRYIDGTRSHPFIVVDEAACKRTSMRSFGGIERHGVDLLTVIQTTILHELGHAVQDALGLEMDEEQAERFAHTYWKGACIIPEFERK
jgi:hypothetical protein